MSSDYNYTTKLIAWQLGWHSARAVFVQFTLVRSSNKRISYLVSACCICGGTSAKTSLISGSVRLRVRALSLTMTQSRKPDEWPLALSSDLADRYVGSWDSNRLKFIDFILLNTLDEFISVLSGTSPTIHTYMYNPDHTYDLDCFQSRYEHACPSVCLFPRKIGSHFKSYRFRTNVSSHKVHKKKYTKIYF